MRRQIEVCRQVKSEKRDQIDGEAIDDKSCGRGKAGRFGNINQSIASLSGIKKAFDLPS